MRDSLHRASDWIYILLADPQRSPVSGMFEKQSGSPEHIALSISEVFTVL
jgi:hypothetical protein